MLSYQYKKSRCEDQTVVRSSFLHNRISCTGKMSAIHWPAPHPQMEYLIHASVIAGHVETISANEGGCYMCNVFFHWPRQILHIWHLHSLAEIVLTWTEMTETESWALIQYKDVVLPAYLTVLRLKPWMLEWHNVAGNYFCMQWSVLIPQSMITLCIKPQPSPVSSAHNYV